MAKLAVMGNPAGSGTVTLQAPPSDTDVVITLPTRSGTLTILPVDIVDFEVNGVKFGESARVNNFALCTTANSTVAKTVTIDGFTLKASARVTVKFGNGNTANNPTLNVSGTGDRPIMFGGASVNAAAIKSNDVLDLVFDGNAWCVVGGIALHDLQTKYNDLLKRVQALEAKA